MPPREPETRLHVFSPAMNQRTADVDFPEPPKINWWARFTSTPPVLQAYIVFAVCYSAFSEIAMFSPLAKWVVPLTSWHGGFLYLGGIYFAVAAATRNNRRKSIYGIQLLLALWTVFGCLEITRHVMWPKVSRWGGNPYLSFHDFRPMFTIVLPAAWALLFFSPGMRKWISTPALQNTEARWQFSLADLLFVLFVVCVALALALALATLMHQTAERFARPSPMLLFES